MEFYVRNIKRVKSQKNFAIFVLKEKNSVFNLLVLIQVTVTFKNKKMTYMKNILILFILLFLSCNEKKEEQKSERDINKITETNIKVKLHSDFSKSAKLFAKDVLKENIRIHTFDISNLKKPNHLKIFKNDGLKKMIAYSNINFPKKSKPSYYEHFTLFVATYENQEKAKKTFEKIKSYSEHRISESRDLEKELSECVKSLNIGAKPGGMITQKGKQIFSLVETCRNTPIGGKWIDYENKFINYLIEKGEEIEVLNANCGDNKYEIEKRTASR